MDEERMPDAAQVEEMRDATTEAPAEESAELERLREESRRQYQDYLRAVADLENFKRLAARERTEAVARTRREMLRVILQAVDTLERALATGEGATTDPVLDGIRLAHRHLLDVLASYGVRPMETLGQTFDPQYHEAVGVGRAPRGAEEAVPPGTITSEVQRGYMHRDEVLRPARVLVVKEDAGPDA